MNWYRSNFKSAQFFAAVREIADPYDEDKPTKADINIELNWAMRHLGLSSRRCGDDEIVEFIGYAMDRIKKAQRMVDFAL